MEPRLVSDLAYGNDIVTLSNSYIEIQCIFAAFNQHAPAICMGISDLKTNVM